MAKRKPNSKKLPLRSAAASGQIPPSGRISPSTSLIRFMPPEERPRDRLLQFGPQSLSDSELLAVLLQTGCPGASALDLARTLINANGGLGGLLEATSGGLPLQRWGVGQAKASVVLAAVELARRIARSELPRREPLHEPEQIALYLTLRYAMQGQEVLGALFVDQRSHLIGECEICRGVANRLTVDPTVVYRRALLYGAAGLILFHSHPAADPAPSLEDLQFTRRVGDAGSLIGIKLLDHLIVAAPGRWVSIRRRFDTTGRDEWW